MIGNVRVGLSSFSGIMSPAAPRFSPSFSPGECKTLPGSVEALLAISGQTGSTLFRGSSFVARSSSFTSTVGSPTLVPCAYNRSRTALRVLAAKRRSLLVQQPASPLNLILDHLARVLSIARGMRCGRNLLAPPYQLIRHLLAHRLRATLLRPSRTFCTDSGIASFEHKLSAASAIHPDASPVIAPRRTLHTGLHPLLPNEFHLDSLCIYVAVVLLPVIRGATDPLALGDRSLRGVGRMRRHTYDKLAPASFIDPNPVLVVSPRRPFFAPGLAQLSH